MLSPPRPFPYFGGKSRAASQVWTALGPVKRYIEPFCGSAAVLLANPHWSFGEAASELINDRNHFIPNLWRALRSDAAAVLELASAPPSEIELGARHRWLEGEGRDLLEDVDWDDPHACNTYVAGVWLYRQCVSFRSNSDLLRASHGSGVKSPSWTAFHTEWLVRRLSRVQVLAGDWKRCVTPAVLGDTPKWRPTVGVFLDPPYGGSDVDYDDNGDTAAEVWAWAIERGDDPRMRIVVAGYDDGRELPKGWRSVSRVEWGGYANRSDNKNRKRERLWLSPHCLSVATQRGLNLGEQR